MKELLEKLLSVELERLTKKAREGLLSDEDVARIPSLARAAEVVQGLRAGTVDDDRTAAELEAAAQSS